MPRQRIAMTRIAIVGSPGYEHRDIILKMLPQRGSTHVILTGNRSGPERLATSRSRLAGVHVRVIDHHSHRYRNEVLASDCDEMIAFWDGREHETTHAIGCAIRLKKPVQVFGCDGFPMNPTRATRRARQYGKRNRLRV